MSQSELHPSLSVLLPMLKGISLILGPNHEVILHDLSHLEHSVIGIEGDITHRSIGSPATNFLLSMLKKFGDDAPDKFHYKSNAVDGRILRSSTVFIRDNGKIIGSLCVNQDTTDYQIGLNLLQGLLQMNDEKEDVDDPKELFANDINEVMERMVKEELQTLKKPITYLNKEDKLCVVSSLEDKGVFAIKGSVEYVAEQLGVTNFTIYNYLKEIRVSKFSSKSNHNN